MQMAMNLLLIAHHFTLEIAPKNYKLRISPFASMCPTKKLKFAVVEKRHELAV